MGKDGGGGSYGGPTEETKVRVKLIEDDSVIYKRNCSCHVNHKSCLFTSISVVSRLGRSHQTVIEESCEGERLKTEAELYNKSGHVTVTVYARI